MITGPVEPGTLLRATFRASEYVEKRVRVGKVIRCYSETFDPEGEVWYYRVHYWDTQAGAVYEGVFDTYVCEDIELSTVPVQIEGKLIPAERIPNGSLVLRWGQEEILCLHYRDSRRDEMLATDSYGESFGIPLGERVSRVLGLT